ncbi:MAG: UDP-N-acetylmuramoylalanyl-D-glutamate-2, 6-diaminopimelate ligase [Microgenomates group bacterium Gr01-1014_93]|nr:MAG: UDP-N-acetylmuramoylalanyl-D-glutamate-2, 6-diaminopimelate ligase [Microgenomates group bacterium Gr01-1014_93]
MENLIRFFLPQWVINYFWHLPKAILANVLYGFPSKKLTVIGVTGTDGKTTTVNMIYQILKEAAKKVSMVSTINAVIGGKIYDTGFHVTSPDPFLVQKFASDALKNGDKYLVLEVTSHALDQFRFWGIKFDVGVITNITHEHLDYHRTFENYKNTKLKLLKNVKFAILNSNLKQYIVRSHTIFWRNFITFGLIKGRLNKKKFGLKLKIPGDYNIENALAALAVANVLKINREQAVKSLENFYGLSGRMEEILNKKGIKIIIDFAHTPNALENALKALRTRATPWRLGRIIALIGCEGFRDVGKRAMMGEISGKLADVTVVTTVDPRGQLESINKEIIMGLKKAGAKRDRNYFIIDDRKEAIDFAINRLAKKGDTIGIFGKGHETSINLDGKNEISWSDKGSVVEILNG